MIQSAALLDIHADMTVAEKARAIETFLGEHYFHDSGIMYSMWNWRGGELRPFRASDRRAGQSYPHTSAGFTPEGHNNSENSPMVSGLFLQSQCHRYHATEDEQALHYAKKAFGSIDAIYRLSEACGRSGFICKPYDWKASEETSIDQYTCVMMGLWAYLPLADRIDQQRIAHMLASMANWWKNAGYQIVYFERRYDLLPYHAPRLSCLNAMAYRATGNEQFSCECNRLLSLCSAWPTTFDNQRLKILQSDPETLRQNDDFFGYDPARGRFKFQTREVSAEIYLSLACADWFLTYGNFREPLLKHVIARYWKQMQYGLRDDLMTLYGMEVDLETETWAPIHTDLTETGRANALAGCVVTAYYSELCWGDFASRIPDASVIAHQHSPEFAPKALSLASAMLQKLDNQRLCWMIDPDGKQLVPDLDWMRNILSSDAPVFAVLTYWRAMAKLSKRDFSLFSGENLI